MFIDINHAEIIQSSTELKFELKSHVLQNGFKWKNPSNKIWKYGWCEKFGEKNVTLKLQSINRINLIN